MYYNVDIFYIDVYDHTYKLVTCEQVWLYRSWIFLLVLQLFSTKTHNRGLFKKEIQVFRFNIDFVGNFFATVFWSIFLETKNLEMSLPTGPPGLCWIFVINSINWIGATSQSTSNLRFRLLWVDWPLYFCSLRISSRGWSRKFLYALFFQIAFRAWLQHIAMLGSDFLHWSHLSVAPAPSINRRVMLLTGHTCVWGPRTESTSIDRHLWLMTKSLHHGINKSKADFQWLPWMVQDFDNDSMPCYESTFQYRAGEGNLPQKDFPKI